MISKDAIRRPGRRGGSPRRPGQIVQISEDPYLIGLRHVVLDEVDLVRYILELVLQVSSNLGVVRLAPKNC